MNNYLILGIALISTLSLAACGGIDTPSGGNTTAPSSASSSEAVASEEPSVAEVAYELGYVGATTWTNSIGTVWVQTIIEIKNTGTADLYLSSGSYDLEDESGSLVAAQSLVSVYPDIIAPGESAVYYEATTLDEVSAGANLTVIPHPKVAKSKNSLVRLPVSDTKLQEGQYTGLELIGRVENNTDVVIDGMTYVSVVLRDAAGVPIGVLFTILMEDLAPGDKVGFECNALSLPESVTLESVASFDVFAYPLQMQF